MAFLARFIFPTVITIALFLTAIFLIVIPTIEKNNIDRKQEMIRELTNSAWNTFAKLDQDVQGGIISREVAQQQAIAQIRNLRYGHELKDYFWIQDMRPRMIAHPYRPDLIGQDLSTLTDPEGKHIFLEMVKLVEGNGDGYLEYNWQLRGDEKRILPKISYVKGFAPWGWIIGTGIYIDDIKDEMAAITNSLIQISLFILLLISLLLLYIDNLSYSAFKKQQLAENALRESEEKYRTLVESAAEGMFMVLEGSLMYVNQTISDLLGYSKDQLSGVKTDEIFTWFEASPENQYLQDLLEGRQVPDRFEAHLSSKTGTRHDVVLSATQISLGGKNGFMAVVSDITKRKRVEDELSASEEKFRTMANNLNLGFFRMTAGKEQTFVEANPALVEMLGYASRENLLALPPSYIYDDQGEFKRLFGLTGESSLRRELVKIKRKDGSLLPVSIWGVNVSDDDGQIQFFDGVIEDISDVIDKTEANKKLLAELQSTVMFYNKLLATMNLESVTTCSGTLPIADAAQLMQEKGVDILLVRDEVDKDCGVVTDLELRKALLPNENGALKTVADIMSTSFFSLPGESSVLDAWGVMAGNDTSHLFITNSEGRATGYIRKGDLLSIQNYSPAVLMREIDRASSPEKIISLNAIQPYLISTLIESGAKPQSINNLTTSINNVIRKKFIEFAIEELGSPPAAFAFIVFGSEGRAEQTLHTDQDNAIVYEDLPAEREESARAYFLALGEKVCSWLNDAGYVFCKGNNMAMNPELCQPTTIWKKHFGTWVYSASGEDLLRAKIFFDFRFDYGDESIVNELKTYLAKVITENNRFLQFLARDILNMVPPISRFGKFIVATSGDTRGGFDIKKAMMPIVDFARIYALKHEITATNTLERLDALRDLKILTELNYQEIIQSYCFLMQMRLKIQADAITTGSKQPDNIIFPKKLTSIDQQLLKEIFTQTKYFQHRLSYDFTGQAPDA